MENINLPLSTITLLVGVFLIFGSCMKDEFGVYDEDFDDLETSYFNYQDSVVVLDHFQVLDLIVQKDENILILVDAEIFDDLSAGSVLISNMETPEEDFLFRKVISLERNSGQIIVQTEIATLYDAFKSYYFNSERSNSIQTRDEKVIWYDLKDLKSNPSTFDFESTLGNIFNQVEEALRMVLPSGANQGINFLSKISVEFDLEGIVKGESIHPYDQFVLNNPSDPVFNGVSDRKSKIIILNNLLDTDGDKICDLVEDYYQTKINDKKEFPVLTQIRIDGFRMSFKPAIKFGKDFGLNTKEILKPGVDFPKNEIQSKLNDTTKVSIDLSASPLEDINYIPVATHPAIPVFGVAFAWHKLATLNGSVSFDVAAEIFSDPIDVVLGVYDFSNRNIEPEVRLERKHSTGIPQSFTLDQYIQNDIDMNLFYAMNANVEFRLGAGMGIALYAGEQNFALVAVGGMINPYLFMEGSVSVGAKYRNIIRDGASVITDVNNYFGYGCLGAGVGIEAYAFTDGKDPTNTLNILDTKLKLFDEKVDLLKNLTGSQFCIGLVPCEGVVVESATIEFSGLGLNDFVFKIKALSNDAGHPKYQVRILEGLEVIEVFPTDPSEYFTFGNSEEDFFINSDALSRYITSNALTLEIKVVNKSPDCIRQILKGNVLIQHCLNAEDPFEVQVATFETKKYFTNVQARAFCLSRGGMMTRDALKSKVENEGLCIDPSGFFATNDNKLSNVTETYVWTLNPSFPTVASLTVIRPLYDDDGTVTYDFESVPISTVGSESAQLKCKCVE